MSAPLLRADTPHPDTLFDAGWLALRRPADTAARVDTLNRLAHDWLRARAGRPLRLIDLGSGSGANPRYLAPRLPGPQHWQLVDHDPALLALAQGSCGLLCDSDGRPADVNTLLRSLHMLSEDDFAGSDLVSASALIDLVDEGWLVRFADACAYAGCAVLITLSVDGHWVIEDGEVADPDDAFVRTAFNAHQQRNKGAGAASAASDGVDRNAGPALGARAAPRLATLLEAQGFRVTLAYSPWLLHAADAGQRALAAALLDGWRAAAAEQCPHAAARIEAWHVRRQLALARESTRIEVGHFDLYAEPGVEI
ncbi:hypothetical protein [Methyloversatilis sp.]|uniref:hypothetical protein n=1 Tax=Methyloversatilis sp. TaxID=2569862 RepID=UPI0027339646|nr:hypothetical protein [Methyloversatilis sp.]MDP2868632.1 hypothetical protein [Methyloversatilis sp.]MDP3456653.1 hypothetical protein [Methyloversatilis sp.]MDP3577256.1 hypothetical protein [Methyloversatilis sp.]